MEEETRLSSCRRGDKKKKKKSVKVALWLVLSHVAVRIDLDREPLHIAGDLDIVCIDELIDSIIFSASPG